MALTELSMQDIKTSQTFGNDTNWYQRVFKGVYNGWLQIENPLQTPEVELRVSSFYPLLCSCFSPGTFN